MKNEKQMNDLALFRFSLISPVVNDTYPAVSKNQYFRDAASRSYTLPDGTIANFSAGTIKKWYLEYKNKGYDSLLPQKRSDAGLPRVLSNDAIKKINDIKEKYPYITGTLVYQRLLEEGYIKDYKTSLSSVLRYIRDNNLKSNQIITVERKAFEMEYAGDCWQADSSHGPVIKANGQKRKTYLISILDDASRIIAHGEFFFNDNAVNFQIVLKKAISKYGLPKRLLVDNGGPYRNDQLSLICASLGIALIHTRPYEPQQKGKIERNFRTIKDGWLNGIDWNSFDSLESLNIAFNQYITENYMNSEHSALGCTPRERYIKDSHRIKFIPGEQLDYHFLHRVTRRVNNDATIQLNNKLFEVPQQYIRQKLNIRYPADDLDKAYIFNAKNELTDTVYPLKRVDNSKIRRASIDFTKLNGGNTNV